MNDIYEITSQNELNKIQQESLNSPVVIYKHSIRCSTSSLVWDRLGRKWDISPDIAKLYFLDLINHRDLSDKIAAYYNVQHESPQILIILNEKCVYDVSHFEIDYQDIKNKLEEIEGISSNVSQFYITMGD